MRILAWAIPLWLLSAAGTGCGGLSPNSMADMTVTGPRTVTLGTVSDNTMPSGPFVPIVDGQGATLVEGAQGGFHVWMKARVSGGPGELTLQKTAYRATDDTIVLRATATLEVGTPGADGIWEMPTATPMFMCPSPIGVQIIEEPIRYEMTLQDDDGNTVGHGEAVMVPHCPTTPDATLTFCQSICKG